MVVHCRLWKFLLLGSLAKLLSQINMFFPIKLVDQNLLNRRTSSNCTIKPKTTTFGIVLEERKQIKLRIPNEPSRNGGGELFRQKEKSAQSRTKHINFKSLSEALTRLFLPYNSLQQQVLASSSCGGTLESQLAVSVFVSEQANKFHNKYKFYSFSWFTILRRRVGEKNGGEKNLRPGRPKQLYKF